MKDETKTNIKFHGLVFTMFTGIVYIVSLVIYLMLFWMVPWRVDWMELLFVMRLWVPVSIIAGFLCWGGFLHEEGTRQTSRYRGF